MQLTATEGTVGLQLFQSQLTEAVATPASGTCCSVLDYVCPALETRLAGGTEETAPQPASAVSAPDS